MFIDAAFFLRASGSFPGCVKGVVLGADSRKSLGHSSEKASLFRGVILPRGHSPGVERRYEEGQKRELPLLPGCTSRGKVPGFCVWLQEAKG